MPTLANPGTFGARVVVSRRNGSLRLGGGVSVVKENVATSNGIVHLIDDVLCAPNSSKIGCLVGM